MGLFLCILSIHSQIQIPFLACLSPLSSNKVPVNPKNNNKKINKRSQINSLPKNMMHVAEKKWNISYDSRNSSVHAETSENNYKAKDRNGLHSYTETDPNEKKNN